MTTQQHDQGALAISSASAGALLMHDASMDRLERLAGFMASGKTTLPQHLRGNTGDCFAIALQSMQWGMNPFAVGQKTHLVNGTLGYEAQLVAAVINSSGVVKDRFNFEWFGDWTKIIGRFKEVTSNTKKDDAGQPKKYIVPAWKQEDEHGLGVRVWATIKGEGQPRVLELLLTQARTRNSTLWTEDPKQQLAYLAQKRWARLHAPDVILGVYTPDELEGSGEKFMGPVEEVKPETVAYPSEQFEKNFPQWEQIIKSRRKTVDELIAFAQSRNPNTPFTEEQLQRLRAVQPVKNAEATDVTPKEAPAQSGATAGPAMTFAQVADKLHAAQDPDALNVAADLIGQVPDAGQQAELNALYEQLLDEMKAE